MFISNNRALFQLWRKETLLKHQKVSNYYENGCLESRLLLKMFLLTAPIGKISHIQARVYFILLKIFVKQT